QSEGYATLVLDSFTARGLKTVCGNGLMFSDQVRANDVFAAAARLVALGLADENRVAAMGFSHGGWTVVAAWRAQGRRPEETTRALIAFYPACPQALPDSAAPPLLMLLGGQDDWTPAAPCMKLAENASRAGRSVSAVLYPDAYHAFDAANLR